MGNNSREFVRVDDDNHNAVKAAKKNKSDASEIAKPQSTHSEGSHDKGKSRKKSYHRRND